MEIIIKRIKELLSRGGLSENGIKVLEFMIEKKRLPKFSIKEEKKLYEWCGRMRKRLPMLKTSYRELNSILLDMGWNSFEKRRKRRANEFFEFVEQHGRLPKGSVKEEYSLYKWCGQVWNNQNGLADRFPEVLEKLKEMKWGEGTDVRTERRFQEFSEFVSKHGRLPKFSIKEEKSLYLWCGQVWGNDRGLADRFPEVLAKLNEMRFGEVYDIKMEKSVRDFWEFVNTHGRLPKPSVKEEKTLYQWCWKVRHNKRGIAEKFPDVLAKIKELKGQK